MLCLGGLAVGATLVAFCVQHDANHGSYFKSRRYNHLVGWTSDLLLGFSSYAWRVKHNVAHHTYTNVDGYDDDIAKSPLARFAPMQPTRPWYRFQHYYVWPLYSLMGLALADRRRSQELHARAHRNERAPLPRRAGRESGSSAGNCSSSAGRSSCRCSSIRGGAS